MPGQRILVVEDERIVAKDLELRLVSLGYLVVGSVATGEDAVRLAGEKQPDLVMMDIRLRGEIDGIEAADQIRRRFQLPIIYLTAHSDEETLRRAQFTEPHGYLLKPFQERELRTVIEMGLYKHQAERKLRASARRYATTLSSIGDGVIATDRDGRVTFLNPIAERLTGWSLAEAAGQPLSVIFRIRDEHTGEPIENPAARVMREGGIATMVNNTLLAHRDGSDIPIEDGASPILDDQGVNDGAVLVFRDIRERRRQQQEKARLDEKIRESSKMEAIGRLAGGVAHDFNNLLTVINGHTDMLLTGKTSAHPEWDSLTAILDAGERAARLTEQLLAFSRRSMIEPKSLDLNEIVNSLLRMLRRLIGKSVEVRQSLQPGLDRIMADQGQVEQILMNMAVNARDAIRGEYGNLNISTANFALNDEDPINFPDLKPGRYVQLTVADDGCGMPPEVRGKIFEPFFTTKGVGQGTGLGLAVVHGIIKQGGGHVGVQSEVGKGTTFRLLFPSSPVTVSPSVAVPQMPSNGNETVLLAEDEEQVRNIARIALQVKGYTVLSALDPADAIRLAESHAGPIQLLITDMVMPDMGGRVLAAAVRVSRPDIRVLYMSGYTDEAIFQEGKAHPYDAFLQKPFSPLVLARKTREVLDAKG